MDADTAAEILAVFHDRLAAADESVQVHGRIGDLRYEVVGADEASPFPSGNPNRARWYGGAFDEVCLEEAISRFDAHDVPVWFCHVYSRSDRDRIQDSAERYGLEAFEGTGYPTMVHDLRSFPEAPTDLRIAELGPVPASHAAMLGGPLHGAPARALAAAGHATFYGAYDGDQLVAMAGILLAQSAAYLGWAVTRENHRGRGAQRALIRERLRHAHRAGCRIALAETLTMLRTSYANLEHAGFRELDRHLVLRCGE